MGFARWGFAASGVGARLLVLLLLGVGCARTGPGPRVPPQAGVDFPAGAHASTEPPKAPEEVMTPAELASIPDPVPGGEAPGDPAGAAGGMPARAPTPSGGDTGASPPSEGEGPPPQADLSIGAPGEPSRSLPEGYLWRVQVFASPELAQADRVAKEASARLGAGYVIQYEDKLYKVRLGAFPSEASAQALRERAVRAGFFGAFRVRTTKAATDGVN